MPEIKLPFRLDASDDDEGYDQFGPNRQFVSQLLLLYLTREQDSLNFPSLGAADLDEMYHEKTEFDGDGPSAKRFRELVQKTGIVCGFGSLAKDETGKNRKKKSFRRCKSFPFFAYYTILVAHRTLSWTPPRSGLSATTSATLSTNCRPADQRPEERFRTTTKPGGRGVHKISGSVWIPTDCLATNKRPK